MRISYLLRIGNIDGNKVLFDNENLDFKNTQERKCLFLHTLMGNLRLVVDFATGEIFGFEGCLNDTLNNCDVSYKQIALPNFLDGQIITNISCKKIVGAMYLLPFSKQVVWSKENRIIALGKYDYYDTFVRVCKNLYISLNENKIDCIIINY